MDELMVVRDTFFSSLSIIFFTLYPIISCLMNTRMFNLSPCCLESQDRLA
jgi:hypothetical protein